MSTRIFIVDDHPAMRHGLARLIEQEPDLEVCGEAGDRDDALEAIDQLAPDFVIVDVALQDRSSSGIDLIRDIQAQGRAVPTLVVSMHDEAMLT